MTQSGVCALLVAVAGSVLAVPALAQDSVGSAGGIAGGDALSAYQTAGTSLQVRNYVVDMPVKVSSWNNEFFFGPAVKASAATSSAYFNHLIGAQAVSNGLTGIQPLLRSTYAEWTAAGQGISPTRNTAPGTFDATGWQGQSFGLAFMEFAGGPNAIFGDSDDENNIIAANIAFTPRQNSRLFVSRIVAATNRVSAATGLIANASFGLGGVDEALNVHFLADGYAMSSGSDPLTTRRLYRVAAASRLSTLNNQIFNSGAGATDSAASRILLNSTTSQTAPTIIPTAVAGRPVMLGADLANNYLFEQTANTTVASTVSHLGAGVSARGPISYSRAVFNRLAIGGTDAGTCAVLCRAPSSTKTRSISSWVVNTNGSADLPVAGLLRLDMPTDPLQLFDRDDNFNPGNTFGSLGNQEFTNYQSQVCFRGGSGPVAVTVLANSGDLLVAAGVAATGSGSAVPQTQDNYIAVARVNATTGSTTWTIAAHTGNGAGSAGGLSKAIYADIDGDRLPETIIGRIARYSEAFPSATNGPSISAPAIDAFGNVYFLATIEIDGSPSNTYKTALLKANFDADTNSYKLELLASLGDVLPGLNSQRNYQIQFLSPADSDSVDSGAVFHSSIVQSLNAVIDPATVTYGSPYSLGAMVFRTKIVYDNDQNNLSIDPSAPGGSGLDQAYNVEMVVIPRVLGADLVKSGGVAGLDGQLSIEDFIAFLAAFTDNDLLADLAGPGGAPYPDGELSIEDFIAFLAAFTDNL